MGWAAIASVAITAITSIMQGQAQAEAASEAARREEALAAERKSIAEENARNVEATGMEENRRLAAQRGKEEAAARAMAAASGALYLGDDEDAASSIALSLKGQKDENKKQLDWQRRATFAQSSAISRQGEYSSSEGKYRAEGYRTQGEMAESAGWFGALGAVGKGLAGSGALSSTPSQAYGSWYAP
jgi:hypothetical protein